MREAILYLARFLPRFIRDRLRYWALRVINPQRHEELSELRRSEGEYSLKPFEELKCIFVHIPKCAGISINQALFGNNGGGHLSTTQYSFAFTPREFETFFKFTIVRHPLDRLVSAFFFLKNGGFDEEDQKWSEQNLEGIESFEQFVLEWLNEDRIWQKSHLYPQFWYLEDCWGEFRIDYMARFENLENDFECICQRLGVAAELPKLNKGSRGKYEEYYNRQTLEKACRLYARDLNAFGYRPPDISSVR